ncbi:Elongation factor 1-beta 2 [Capsicum baccatum]|uniref:Elongation factor 1-beta 2 n=1 Tax=Capsicum baccatum TaxID=33114 RepID=A0A2G2XR79_CAPBA|nr:Elongation factor 1-beta 2 [Capsicum baccatum]
MVVAFSNLHTESGLKSVKDQLFGKTYISGDQLTKDDIKVYGAILEQPSSDLYPNASKCQAAPAIVAPAKEAANPADDNNDDDGIDLFGEETEEEKKEAEARKANKTSTKKKESEKSSVLWASKFRHLEGREGAMPNLAHLEIEDGKKLEKVPDGMR